MKKILLGLVLCWNVLAANTVISQTVTGSDGNVANGTVLIRISAACQSGSVYVIPGNITVPFLNGVFSTTLPPNDTCIPSSTSYSAVWKICSATVAGTLSIPCPTQQFTSTWTETWLVPTSITPVTVQSIVVQIPPSISYQIPLSQLASDGATSGQALCFSTHWGPGNCGGSNTGLTGGCTFSTTAINGPCKVTISAAQLNSLSNNTSSIMVLPAVAGKSYFILSTYSYLHFVSVPFAGSNNEQRGLVLLPPGADSREDPSLYVTFYLVGSILNDQQVIGVGGNYLTPSPTSYVGKEIDLYSYPGINAGGGSLYANGDTGTISGCGDGTAIYTVATSSGGAVQTVTVTGGTGYSVVNWCATTIATGAGDGNLILNIGAAPGGVPSSVVVPPNGDGTLDIYLIYLLI